MGAVGGNISSEDKAAYEAEIEALKLAMEQSQRTSSEVSAANAERRIIVPEAEAVKGPHLMNLNEDPMLVGYIKHEFKAGMNKLGKASSNPDVTITGLGISDEHAYVNFENGAYTIQPIGNAKTLVNGAAITGPTTIQHGDRVRFGNHLLFTFVDPDQDPSTLPDFETAEKEASDAEVQSMLGSA